MQKQIDLQTKLDAIKMVLDIAESVGAQTIKTMVVAVAAEIARGNIVVEGRVGERGFSLRHINSTKGVNVHPIIKSYGKAIPTLYKLL